MDAVVVTVVVLVCILVYFLLKKRDTPVVPSPPIDPKTGDHTPLIAKAGSFISFAEQIHKKYGRVVQFSMNKNNPPIFSINDPDLVKQTLKMGSRPTHLFTFLEPLVGKENMQIYNAQRAKAVRRVLAPPFGSKYLEESFPKVVQSTNVLVNSWEKKIGEVIPAQKELLKTAMVIGSRLLLGDDAMKSVDPDQFQHNYDTIMNLAMEGQLSPLSEEKKQTMKQASEYIHDVFTKIMAKKTKFSPDTQKNLLEVLLTEDDPDTVEPFTPYTIEMLLRVYVIAAYHTTVTAVSWTLFMLTQHPDIQRKCQEEADKVELTESSAIEVLDNLEYITKVIKETLRMYPAPFAARLVEQDMKIGSYTLPANSTLFYPISVIHKSTEHWENPSKFDPERFTPENISKRHRLSYCPFGIGPRICPGEQMALVEIKVFLTLLLQKFTFTLATPASNVVPLEKFVLWAKDDILIKITPRK